MFSIRILLFLLILAAMPCVAAPAEQSVTYDQCQISGHLRDTDRTGFTIKVEDALYTFSQLKEVKSWKGVTEGNPYRMTIQVDLRISSVPVKIPVKAYVDLGNPLIPSGITLTQSGGEIHLNIRGGDGPAAYIARFIVINNKLVRREIVPAGNPDSEPEIMAFN